MAKIANPRKSFQFNIIIPGMNPFLAQEVKTPDGEFDIVEHGDTGHLIKTAGLRKINQLTVNKISTADGPDELMQLWQNQIYEFRRGGGAPPSVYKKPILVEQYANDGITVIKRRQYIGCWPQKVNGEDLSRKASENTMNSIEFCVDSEE